MSECRDASRYFRASGEVKIVFKYIKQRMTTINNICMNVFIFAEKDVTTGLLNLSAIILIKVVSISRTTIIKTIHKGIISIITKEMNADVVKNLSASGSMKLPHAVAALNLRAHHPSSQSVIAPITNSIQPTCIKILFSEIIKKKNTGEISILEKHRILGIFVFIKSNALMSFYYKEK